MNDQQQVAATTQHAPDDATDRAWALAERRYLLELLRLTGGAPPRHSIEVIGELLLTLTGAVAVHFRIDHPLVAAGGGWEYQIVNEEAGEMPFEALRQRGQATDDAQAYRSELLDGHQVARLRLAGHGATGLLVLATAEGHGLHPATRELMTLISEHATAALERLALDHLHQSERNLAAEIRRRMDLDGIEGHSAALGQVLQQCAAAAPLDITMLLTGESGTGKSALARIVARNGPRRDGPFIELNCASMPDSLLESELFGAVQGAHSTANRKIPGKLAAAEGGTLFLDEVGELSPQAQAKLLRVIQDHVYFPLGSNVSVRADVRIIAATNVHLRDRVDRGLFREDLWYRLHVFVVRVPTLSERREDIPALIACFVKGAADRHGLPRLRLAPDALRAAMLAAWPGQVRQLAHAVESGLVRAVSEGKRSLMAHHLFPELKPPAPAESTPRRRRGDALVGTTLQATTKAFRRGFIQTTLEDCRGNVSQAAARLGIARSHIYTLIKELDILVTRPEDDG